MEGEDEEWERQQEEGRRQRKKKAQERHRLKEEQRRKKQQEQQECEVLGDGTQVCDNSGEEVARMEAKAREIAAERRRRRIEENMANAPVVNAVDSTEVGEEESDSAKEEHDDASTGDEQGHPQENIDPMGCIPPTHEMHTHQRALDSLSKALAGIEHSLGKSPGGSTQRMQMLRQQEKLRSESKKHTSALQMEQNKAKSMFWAERANRVKARDQRRALGSIPFCEGGGAVGGESSKQDEENDAERYTRLEAVRERAEQERRLEKERNDKFQEEARRAEEAQKKAEVEIKRLEREERMVAKQREAEEKARLEEAERLASESKRLEKERKEREIRDAETAKQAESETRLERERSFAEQKQKEEEEARRLSDEETRLEAERLEQERLAAEVARQAELERLEKERIEQELFLAEQRKKDEEEARRLVEEQTRLEAARLEQERLAAEAAKKEEQARQVSNAKVNAEEEAKQAIEQSKEIAADNPDFLPSDVRFAAGRLKNDLLAHYISASPEMVDASDRSGWRPIHEAARAGNVAGVQLLVSAGCDLTSRTGRTGKGGTALWWAIQRFGEDHRVVRLLRSHGALEDGPA
mmetsp:Transcript_12669/g.22187  ORF Transcript_12669/g.22187 Transcript_12669/m.22187 type:complete len:585 (+) Transcript_12669:1-1755(+)